MPSFGVVLGSTILLHAVYSAYEFARFSKLHNPSGAANTSIDIQAQIIVGLVIILLSATITAVRKMVPIKVADMNVEDTVAGEDRFAYLEIRPNFQDLQEKRKEFLDWRKSTVTK